MKMQKKKFGGGEGGRGGGGLGGQVGNGEMKLL